MRGIRSGPATRPGTFQCSTRKRICPGARMGLCTVRLGEPSKRTTVGPGVTGSGWGGASCRRGRQPTGSPDSAAASEAPLQPAQRDDAYVMGPPGRRTVRLRWDLHHWAALLGRRTRWEGSGSKTPLQPAQREDGPRDHAVHHPTGVDRVPAIFAQWLGPSTAPSRDLHRPPGRQEFKIERLGPAPALPRSLPVCQWAAASLGAAIPRPGSGRAQPVRPGASLHLGKLGFPDPRSGPVQVVVVVVTSGSCPASRCHGRRIQQCIVRLAVTL